MSVFARLVRIAFAFGILLAVAAAHSGCHFPVQQADPNDPLFHQRVFALEPLTFTNFMVGDKPEAMYLAGKKPDQQQSFETDKAEAARLFGAHLAATAGSAGISVGPPGVNTPFFLRVNVEFFEPGNFNGFVNFASELRMTMYVVNAQGQPLGQTPLVAQVPATLANPSSGGRFRAAAESLGDAAAHYILRRTGLGY
jgi:hypothetical protein